MSQPTCEEVEAFITALKYGMKVTHKPEFLIALAEGWLENHKPKTEKCDHNWFLVLPLVSEDEPYYACIHCRKRKNTR